MGKIYIEKEEFAEQWYRPRAAYWAIWPHGDDLFITDDAGISRKLVMEATIYWQCLSCGQPNDETRLYCGNCDEHK